MIHLVSPNKKSLATIMPLGARVTELLIDDTQILRKDDGDNSKRSGIPILGPIVDANVGIWQNLCPHMPQHGSDRITDWQVKKQDETSVTLYRTYDGLEHPLIGEAEITFTISNSALSITRVTTNKGNSTTNVGTGLHTYFVPNATFAELEIFPIENGKSYHLDGLEKITTMINEKRFVIESQPIPLETVVWAENTDDHVCVEPWWAHVGDAPVLHAGESRTESYTIRCNV